MRFEEVPGIPRAWTDFVRRFRASGDPFDPARFGRSVDRVHRTSGDGPLPDGALAVAAHIRPGPLGGPVSEWLKCLTAVRVAAELSARGWRSTAVIGLHPDPPGAGCRPTPRLVDSRGVIRTIDPAELGLLAELLRVPPPGEGARLPGLLLGRLLGEENAVVLESSAAAALPAVVEVVGFDDVLERADSGRPGEKGPVLWPRASATLLDARSRRTLERYGLGPGDLFAGEEAAVGRILGRMRTTVPGRLEELRGEVLRVLSGPGPPGGAGERFLKFRDSCRGRIVYQLDKVRRQCLEAVAVKEAAARRRVRRACHALAPGGRPQEEVFGGVWIPLRFSPAGLGRLRERLDILSPEHQLIEMD
ncbi:MAG: bacillithiol biosynthesis BshC [Acidobacteria bacterium]|nr:bacillithiol biosynthesis BshC [Acidobacteriota bacterium]